MTADDENHRRLRRIQSHAFSEKALGSQADIIDLYISKLIFNLSEKAFCEETSVVDLVNWYNCTTFDLIGDLALGEPFGCLDHGLLHPWVRCMVQYIRTAVFHRAFASISPALASVMQIFYRSQVKDAKNHLRYGIDLARKRTDTKTARPDFSESLAKF